MPARSFAWFMTAVAIVMVVVSGARTYTFLLATAVVIVIAIFAWRRVNAHTQPSRE